MIYININHWKKNINTQGGVLTGHGLYMFVSHWINLQAPDFEGQRCPQATGYRVQQRKGGPKPASTERHAAWGHPPEQVLPHARFSAELLHILVPSVADPDENNYL